MKLPQIKIQLIIFLALFGLSLSVINKDLSFLSSGFSAVISAVIFDAFFVYFKEKKLKATDSSVISGLIIAIVLYSEQPVWIFISAAFFAMASKHLIRIKAKHIFNPAALGIFLAIILFKAETVWRGTYFWQVLIPLGLYFSYKIRKLEVIAGYFLLSLILFGGQAIMQQRLVYNIFGYLSYFYIFMMVIEPKTSPVRPLGKFIFGAGVAILVFILNNLGVKFDAELCSLLLLNAFVPLLNKIA